MAEKIELGLLRRFATKERLFRVRLLDTGTLSMFGPPGQNLLRMLIAVTPFGDPIEVVSAFWSAAPEARRAMVEAAIDELGLREINEAVRGLDERPRPEADIERILGQTAASCGVLDYGPGEFAVWRNEPKVELIYGKPIAFYPAPEIATFYGGNYIGFCPSGSQQIAINTAAADALAATCSTYAATVDAATFDGHWLRRLGVECLTATPAPDDPAWVAEAIYDAAIRHEVGHTLRFGPRAPVADILSELGEDPDDHVILGPPVPAGDDLRLVTFLLSDVIANLTSWPELDPEQLRLSFAYYALSGPVPEEAKSFTPRSLFLWFAYTNDYAGLLDTVATILREGRDSPERAIESLRRHDTASVERLRAAAGAG